MKRRWIFYLLAGILFGVFDFFFQIWVNHLLPAETMSNTIRLVLILGVWLALVLPIALHEAKLSRSAWLAAAASVLTWSAAVVAYYLFMGVKLILIGEATRPEMHISNRHDPYFQSNVIAFFRGDFMDGVSEWMIVAVIGGSLIGFAVGYLRLRFQKTG